MSKEENVGGSVPNIHCTCSTRVDPFRIRVEHVFGTEPPVTKRRISTHKKKLIEAETFKLSLVNIYVFFFSFWSFYTLFFFYHHSYFYVIFTFWFFFKNPYYCVIPFKSNFSPYYERKVDQHFVVITKTYTYFL